MKRYLQLRGSHCIIAEMSGIVAGFILTECGGEIAHVITLDVLETYRRQSVGSRLLEASEREAASQGPNYIYLETATTNKAAIALWKKHGYRETGIIENFYGRGQDAFKMLKILERKSQGKVLS